MSEELKESKQGDENTDEEGSASKTNTGDSKSGEDASKQTTEDPEVDYKAELEEERARLQRAEKKIVDLKRQQKDEEKEDDVEDLDAKIDALVEAKLSKITLASAQSSYDEAVEETAKSKEEAELIKFHLENSLKPSGNVKADVQKAKLLANAKKVMATVKELGEALKSKSTQGSANSSSYGKREEEGTVYSDEEKRLLTAFAARTGKSLKDLKIS